jgi:hypothetical protein
VVQRIYYIKILLVFGLTSTLFLSCLEHDINIPYKDYDPNPPDETAYIRYKLNNDSYFEVIIEVFGDDNDHTESIMIDPYKSIVLKIEENPSTEEWPSPFQGADSIRIFFGSDLSTIHYPDQTVDTAYSILNENNWEPSNENGWDYLFTIYPDYFIQSIDANSILYFDTIYPASYYPIYPGSWWEYLVDDSKVLIVNADPEFKLHYFRKSENYSWIPKIYSTPKYVPFLESKPIYAYDKIEHIYAPFGDYYKKYAILSEHLGYTYVRKFTDGRWGDFNEHLVVKDKYFDGLDSVILVEGHWVYGNNVNKKSYQTYIKDLGLKNHFIVDTVSLDTLYKQELIDFYINK